MDRHSCKYGYVSNDESSISRRIPDFELCEKTPFLSLTVANQAANISLIRTTSATGFSAITHVQTSIPAAMADGVNTSNGRATR